MYLIWLLLHIKPEFKVSHGLVILNCIGYVRKKKRMNAENKNCFVILSNFGFAIFCVKIKF